MGGSTARHPLDRLAGGDRSLDADRGGLAELGVEPELRGQRRLDDLLLHLAVERQAQLLPRLVLVQADQRVLVGELGERVVQRAAVLRPGDHDRFERGRSEVVLAAEPTRLADRIADPDRTETPDLGDLAGDGLGSAGGRAPVEDLDGGDGVLADAVAHSDRAAEQSHERHPLPGRTAVDLEGGAGQRPGGVAGGRGQQLGDARGEAVDARAGDRGAEEHGMHRRRPRLRRERPVQPVARRHRLADEGGEHAVVVVSQRREVELVRTERHEAGGAASRGRVSCPWRSRTASACRRSPRAAVPPAHRLGRSC